MLCERVRERMTLGQTQEPTVHMYPSTMTLLSDGSDRHLYKAVCAHACMSACPAVAMVAESADCMCRAINHFIYCFCSTFFEPQTTH